MCLYYFFALLDLILFFLFVFLYAYNPNNKEKIDNFFDNKSLVEKDWIDKCIKIEEALNQNGKL